MTLLMTLIFAFQAQAQLKSNLYQKPEVPHEEKKSPPKKQTLKSGASSSGNLPSYYLARNQISMEESPVILPQAKQTTLNQNMNIGDVVQAEISESLIAFAEAKAPIRAIIKSGKLKGAILIGEATLEKNSKRILITFNKMRPEQKPQVWQVGAQALDQKGILGIEGKIISSEEKYFAAEFLTAGVAGYTDSTVERNQNAIGNYVEIPGTNTFAKKALTIALSKTADRYGDKLKSVPEYALLEGPFEIQILITESPTLIN